MVLQSLLELARVLDCFRSVCVTVPSLSFSFSLLLICVAHSYGTPLRKAAIAPSKLSLSIRPQDFMEQKENIAREVEQKPRAVGALCDDLRSQEGENSDSKLDKDALVNRLREEKESLALRISDMEARESKQSALYQSMRNRLRKKIKALETANSTLRNEVAVLNRLCSNDSLTTLNRSLQNEVTRLVQENLVS